MRSSDDARDDASDDVRDDHETPPHFLGAEHGGDPAPSVYTGCVPENPPYTTGGVVPPADEAFAVTSVATTPASEAQRHLAILEEQVRAAGRDGDVPPQLLHMAAIAWERWHQAAQVLAREGITVQTSQGVGAHPAAMIERQACATYQNLISRMGLSATPSQARYKANKTPRLKRAMTIADLMSRQAEEVSGS